LRTLGIATSIILALGVLATLVLIIVSLPDLARYRRLRRM
jgi:hypothetical protein